MVDILFYGASVAILLLLLHQLFWSEPGSLRHQLMGTISMGMGTLLVVLVMVTGVTMEDPSLLYTVHRMLGAVFLGLLFLTGFTGWGVARLGWSSLVHECAGDGATVFLAVSLIAGILAALSG